MDENKIKASIVAELDETSSTTISKQTEEAVKEGFNNASEQKFNWKTIKNDLTKSISQALDVAWKSSGKVQERQSKVAERYKGAQKSVLDIIGKQGKGYGKSLKIIGAIGKQGMAGAAGMLANINPYVAAVKIAAEAAKFMADQFERITKESSKFVGQGSIFTNKETISMMQRTGQTATQAQGTQRSLSALGLNFEDIQSGKITSEQAALFEKLRARELAKLEEINKVAGPMFKSLQQMTLGITLLMQDINDWITMAFASADGIESLIGSIKGFLNKIGPFIQAMISNLKPALSIIGEIFAVIINITSALMPIATKVTKAVTPLISTIAKIVSVIGRVLSTVIAALGAFLEILMAFNPVLDIINGALGFVMKALDWLIEGISWFAKILGDIVGAIAGWVNGLIKLLKGINIGGYKPFKDMEYIDVSGIKSGITNSGSTYENQTTNNYIYGSQSMNQASPRQNNNDLFTNSYVLVND